MRSSSATDPKSPIMHLVMKTRNNASLHDSAFHRAHTGSHGVSPDGPTAPRRPLTCTGKRAASTSSLPLWCSAAMGPPAPCDM